VAELEASWLNSPESPNKLNVAAAKEMIQAAVHDIQVKHARRNERLIEQYKEYKLAIESGTKSQKHDEMPVSKAYAALLDKYT